MIKSHYRSNAERLLKKMNGALIVIAAYKQLQLSGDMTVPFLQEGNFWWLCGVDAPGWKVVIDGITNTIILVRPRLSDVQVTFEGTLSDDEACKRSGADRVIDEKDFEAELRQLHRRHSMVYTIHPATNYQFVPNPAQHELVTILKRIFNSVQDCTREVSELRSIKTPEEVVAIKKAVNLTTRVFSDIRSQLDKYSYEYEIEADMTRGFRWQNATHAYEPIVACGENALTLHYVANNTKLAKNKLVLIDVGARANGYCADITRTYCINPTKRQRQVHDAVERAHHAIIALIKPGLPVVDYVQRVDEIMKDAMIALGLLSNRSDNALYRTYFPHAVSHGLGVDVHDSLAGARYLAEGMVLTVEPGIYIPEEGIAVRIEDNILVTKTGHKNLSGSLSTNL